jgi:RNA polymerase sigma factor (sigma-70 family)
VSQVPTRLLNHFLAANRAAGPTDHELLRRYARTGDQAAFAEIVRRHGPMVLGAAARVLGRDPAAEDAFQVAFAALARGARSVRTESVAGWLHRTTIRAALRLRTRLASRPTLPEAVPGPATDPCAEVAWREVRRVLDRELETLPERLRVPLVLCYLEALTRDEAAARLGWSLRTLERRLGQGRATLLARLRRRGVTSVGLALGSTAGGLTLPVPIALADAAVRSAPRPAVPVPIGFGLAAAAVIVVGVGIGLGARPPAPAGDPPPKDSPPPAAEAPPADAPDVPLPPGAVRRFGSLTWRHPGGISEAHLSADGKALVTFGRGTIAVWDVVTGRRTYYSRDLEVLNTTQPGNVAIAPDGSWLAYLSPSKGAVRVVESATGKERLAAGVDGKLPGLPGNVAQANVVTFRSVWVPAGGKTLLLCDDKTLFAFDAVTGKEERKLTLPGQIVAITPDGKRAMLHDQSNPARAWVYDLPAGKEVVPFDGEFQKPGSNSWFIRAAISADGKRVATLSDLDAEIRLWDADTGKLVHTLKRAKPSGPLDDTRLVSVAISADGRTVYAGGISGAGDKVRRWDAETGKELDPWPASFSSVAAVVVGKDTVFACSDDGLIRRRDAATGKERPGPTGHTEVTMAARSPDGRTVVTSDHTGRLFVWDAGSGKLTRTVALEGDLSGPPFAFGPDGKRFACSLRDGRVALFDPATWKSVGEIKVAGGDFPFVRHLRFLADGSGLLVGHGSDHLERWDFGAHQPRWSLAEQMLAFAVSPDGNHFAVSVAKGVSIRSAADGSEVRLIPAVAEPDLVVYPVRVDALAFSPDGSLVAGTRWDVGDVFVWDVATGREVHKLVGHPTPHETRIGETSVAFSADGRWLATGHADRTARIWELATGKEAQRLTHDATVTGVSFVRDGRTLLTSAGLEVLLWDLASGADPKADLEALWTDLGSDDAAKAHRAAASLAARGDKAAEFLKAKLPPVPAPDAAAVAKWVSDLDSNRFAAREAATRALAELGPPARPALEAGLKSGPSAEGGTRIQELLTKLRQPLTEAEARPSRAVQALQWAGGDASRAVLKAWAAGAPGARLTDEARRALAVLD